MSLEWGGRVLEIGSLSACHKDWVRDGVPRRKSTSHAENSASTKVQLKIVQGAQVLGGGGRLRGEGRQAEGKELVESPLIFFSTSPLLNSQPPSRPDPTSTSVDGPTNKQPLTNSSLQMGGERGVGGKIRKSLQPNYLSRIAP